MALAVRRFTQLPAWQACNTYKQAVYRLCAEGPLSRDWDRRGQLEESVAGPPAHIAEGFGRFNPTEFAGFTIIARSSLMESRSHLRDAVDRQYISEAKRLEVDALAEEALRELNGLMEYLQSAEAQHHPRRAPGRAVTASQERPGQATAPTKAERPRTRKREPRAPNRR